MPTIDNVGWTTFPPVAECVVTMASLSTTNNPVTRVARGSRGPPRATRVPCLLLHQLGLNCRRQLRREVDVARKAGLALHRMGLTGRRILEYERWEVRRRRLLATGRERHGPVDREARMVVLR